MSNISRFFIQKKNIPISGLRRSRNMAVSIEILRLGDAANAPGAACEEPNVSERISNIAACAREHVCPLKDDQCY